MPENELLVTMSEPVLLMAAPEPDGLVLFTKLTPLTTGVFPIVAEPRVSAPALLIPPPAAAMPSAIVRPTMETFTPLAIESTPAAPLPLIVTSAAPGPSMMIGRVVLVRAIVPRPRVMVWGVAKRWLVSNTMVSGTVVLAPVLESAQAKAERSVPGTVESWAVVTR